MKCEVCRELLEEYIDAELAPQDRERVGAHLSACAECSQSFAALTAEEELFARYDRDVEVPPFLWTRVAAHTVAENNKPQRSWFLQLFARPAAAIAMLLLVFAIGIVYLRSRPKAPEPSMATGPSQVETPNPRPQSVESAVEKREVIASRKKQRSRVKPPLVNNGDQSDVLSSDVAYLDIDEQDTAKHIEQTENLLRSIRNVTVPEGEEEIDVTYDKALSRRLLNENVVLRRDAEMKAKFPTKTLLTDLEPFLIDIANLPDRARPEDVRVIKERVQKTEIVAALLDYQDRGTNNR